MQLAKSLHGKKFIVIEKDDKNKAKFDQEYKVNYNKCQLLKNKP